MNGLRTSSDVSLYGVDSDELYPYYFLVSDSTGYGLVALTAEEKNDYDRVQKEWRAWQDRLKQVY